MAAIEERSGRYRIHFRYHGKQHYLLMRLKQRLIELPPGVDIVEFVQFDGKPPADLQEVSVESRELTLAGFRDRYLATHSESLEDRTIEGIGLHFKHLVAALGERFPIRELKLADLQGYVDRRAKAKGMSGRRLSSATIKKELVTLRTAWNWAEKMGMVTGRFPYHGLRYPKSSEKPPFQTIDEIERRLKAGGITTAQRKELWESLYLRAPEIAELLAYAKEHAAHPWIYPMICMAAHTGARRSELTRMLVTDVDFDGGSVTIREKNVSKARIRPAGHH
jgi:integrase